MGCSKERRIRARADALVASEINISCVIDRKKSAEALQAVHDVCILGIETKAAK